MVCLPARSGISLSLHRDTFIYYDGKKEIYWLSCKNLDEKTNAPPVCTGNMKLATWQHRNMLKRLFNPKDREDVKTRLHGFMQGFVADCWLRAFISWSCYATVVQRQL